MATADVPPFARAAMDGYAVRAEDTTGATRAQPRSLKRVATLFTGEVTERARRSRRMYRNRDRGTMPPGADAVVIVEETDGEMSGAVLAFSPVTAGRNVGPQGADIRTGQRVLEAGTTLTPSRLGATAALGLGEVTVYARPRVAILSTGNEIVEPGRPLKPGQIYDVNRFTLTSSVSIMAGSRWPTAPHQTP